jgi:aldehyde dehydrogenase (NAD+)
MTLSEVERIVSEKPSIPSVVAHLRQTFKSGRTRPLEWRIGQLHALERLLTEREKDLVEALQADLGRNATDAWLADLAPTAAESAYARKHLRTWAKAKRVGLPLAARPGRAWYEYEPLGVVTVIGPWNYPINLTLGPLIGAIAAGNCAVLKPSEHTPAVSAQLAKLVPQYLDSDAFAVVEGAAAETQEILDQGLDHCFFTGGPEIAKHVMAGAAKHLTPVTLELGGRSPVIVAADADIRVAARRVAYAKSINSGQTCIAPDHVLVDRSVRDEFVTELQKAIEKFVVDDNLPLVHERRTQRIGELIAGAGGKVVRGGKTDPARKRAQLTVIQDPDADAEIMTEEIFGPVLPVVTVDSLDDAITRVNSGPKPLAVYLFSSSKATERRILDEISNGGTVINHLLFQFLVPALPFGGVGNSGTGSYHGFWGFETFSHRKAVLRKPARPDPSITYPPYTKLKQRLLRMVF